MFSECWRIYSINKD